MLNNSVQLRGESSDIHHRPLAQVLIPGQASDRRVRDSNRDPTLYLNVCFVLSYIKMIHLVLGLQTLVQLFHSNVCQPETKYIT